MEKLGDPQHGTERRLARIGGGIDHLFGRDYERGALRTPDAVERALGASFGTVRPVSERELTAHLQVAVRAGQLPEAAARDVRWASGIFLWEEPGAPPVFCVVEVSVAAGLAEVIGATRRAAALTCAGIEARPVVISDSATNQAKQAMEANQVAWQRVASS